MTANIIAEVTAAEQRSKAAHRTKPPCPVLTAAAIQHYDNVSAMIERRREQLYHDLQDAKS
jgi:hypothetical protein